MPRTHAPTGRSMAATIALPPPLVRLSVCLIALGWLAGCAQQRPEFTATQQAAHYIAHARRTYAPPGPSGDPWGPFIGEAAAKYDVPERWVREVMRQESDGQLYENGQLITSDAGAMGLMQVMPATYEGLRQRYDLGEDPFDPHDNIMAGTAYIREMYDLYGTPAFLAAYNAGPGRLDDYLTRHRTLPDETRHYLARVGPRIAGVDPQRRSQATQYAMNQIPTDIPAGPRTPRGRSPAPAALAANTRIGRGAAARGERQFASLPEPPPPPPAAPTRTVAFMTTKPGKSGFQLISKAMADTLPVHTGGSSSGNWAIQVGAFGSHEQARAAAEAARGHASGMLASARPLVGAVKQPKGTLYRARLTGLSRDAAMQACEKLGRHANCVVVSPDAQS